MTLRIGVHPSNPTIDTLSRHPELQKPLVDAGVDYRFLRHPDGVETVNLFRIGAIDLGGTGFTPPITLLDQGVDVVFLATSAPRLGAAAGGIVVRADSGITETAQLRGKSIALALGSWQTSSLAFSLRNAGLAWDDVLPVSLGEAAARQSFLAGDLDAWVIDDPTLSNLRADVDVRVLTPTEDVLSHPSVFFGTRAITEQEPDAVRVFLEALDATDAWISTHLDEAAELLAEGTLRRPADIRVRLSGRPWGLRLPSAEFLDEEQRAAELLHEFGILGTVPAARSAVPATQSFNPSSSTN